MDKTNITRIQKDSACGMLNKDYLNFDHVHFNYTILFKKII